MISIIKKSHHLQILKKKKDASKAFEDPVMTVNFLHEGIKINANINSDLKNVLNLIDQTTMRKKC